MKAKNSLGDMVWVAAGGAIGASLRYGTGQFLDSITNSDQAIILTHAAFENILGSFAIGIVYTILLNRTGKNHPLSLFLLTGVIGSYTTYSGFMVENLLLLQSDLMLFAGYISFQIGTGIAAAIAGIKLGNLLIHYLQKSK
jgi:CrcB protein